MKYFLFLILFNSSLFGTTYFVSNSGNDSNNGTSTATPWQHISKVNSFAFASGDSILFQAGGTWAEQLTTQSTWTNLTLDLYGIGARPILTGSSVRANVILSSCSNATGMVVRNLQLQNSTDRGFYQCGSGSWNLTGLAVTNNGGEGIRFDGGTNNQVTNSTLTNNGDDGVTGYQSSGLFIDSVTATGNCTGVTDSFCAGIKLVPNITTTNVIIQNSTACSQSSNGGSNSGAGIWVDTTGNGIVIRNNTTCNNNVAGINVDATNNALVYGNVVYGNANYGILAQADGNPSISGTQIYNNTIYGNLINILVTGPAGGAINGCINNLIKNNLSITGTQVDLLATNGCNNPGVNGSGNVYIYNGFSTQSSNFIQWGVTNYSTYSSWEVASGNCGIIGCSHSLQVDPLLVSPGTGNFFLQGGSPALGAGIFLAGVSSQNPPNMGALGVQNGGSQLGGSITIGGNTIFH